MAHIVGRVLDQHGDPVTAGVIIDYIDPKGLPFEGDTTYINDRWFAQTNRNGRFETEGLVPNTPVILRAMRLPDGVLSDVYEFTLAPSEYRENIVLRISK